MSQAETPSTASPVEEYMMLAVPAEGQVRFIDADGQSIHEPFVADDGRVIETFAGRIAELYLQAGGQKFIPENLAGPTARGRFLTRALRLLEEVAPPEIITRRVQRGDELYAFGHMAIASLVPQTRIETEQPEPEALKPAAGEAVDLTRYDHSIITVGDMAYVLQLDSPDTIMAARVVQAMGQVERRRIAGRDVIDRSKLSRVVWDMMPPAERALFVTGQRAISGEHYVLRHAIEHTLGSFTSLLGITRRGRLQAGEYNVTDRQLAVRHVQSPSLESQTQRLRPVFPPGTPRERVRLSKTDAAELDPRLLARGRVLVGMAETPGRLHLSQDAAVEVLDDIMSRPGKRAIMVALQGRQPGTLAAVMQRLHEASLTAVGHSAYLAAVKNRYIAGNTLGRRRQGRVRQVSGRMNPGSTRSRIAEPVLSCWTIVD